MIVNDPNLAEDCSEIPCNLLSFLIIPPLPSDRRILCLEGSCVVCGDLDFDIPDVKADSG